MNQIKANHTTMKKVALLASFFASFGLMAQNVQLVVEQVNNQGLVPGNTYRVYAQLPSTDHSLHAVFGDSEGGMHIESTAAFYQHPYGGNTAIDINSAMTNLAPELAYDSWLTIGRDNGDGNNLWEVGINFDGFNAGNALDVQDGAWFLIPTHPQTKEGNNGLILIGQFTTTGVATGTINLQGWDADNKAWQARNLNFVTTNAQVLGCTDSNALNFNAQATYNNGTCEFAENNGTSGTSTSPVVAPSAEPTKWSIFPNPVFEGQINIQFSQVLDPSKDNVTISIFDMNGKLVQGKELKSADVIGGNRVILNADLAAGSYTVNVRHGSASESQIIVVQK